MFPVDTVPYPIVCGRECFLYVLFPNNIPNNSELFYLTARHHPVCQQCQCAQTLTAVMDSLVRFLHVIPRLFTEPTPGNYELCVLSNTIAL